MTMAMELAIYDIEEAPAATYLGENSSVAKATVAQKEFSCESYSKSHSERYSGQIYREKYDCESYSSESYDDKIVK